MEAHDLSWESVRFTFGDERCVPPDDPQATFEWREKIFLCLLPFLRNQSCVCVAKLIRKSQRRRTQQQLDAIATGRGEPIYQHDLILLGLGDDGHTASLFPGTLALGEMARCVVANFVSKLNAWRLTFTYPLINSAAHFVSRRRIEKSRIDPARARRRREISRRASDSRRGRSDMDNWGVAQARNDGFSAVTYSVTQASRLARLNSKMA